MQQSSLTYTAPGQGLTSLVLAVVSYFARENRFVSTLFNGRLSNAFLWRCIVGGLATDALLLYASLVPQPDGWYAFFALVIVATMVPAFAEYSLNVGEE